MSKIHMVFIIPNLFYNGADIFSTTRVVPAFKTAAAVVSLLNCSCAVPAFAPVLNNPNPTKGIIPFADGIPLLTPTAAASAIDDPPDKVPVLDN